MFERGRSKAVELLALGSRITLTLGWSDGHTFVPLDFSLLSSGKLAINGMNENINKRSHGYKRRQEALLPVACHRVSMLDRTLKAVRSNEDHSSTLRLDGIRKLVNRSFNLYRNTSQKCSVST